MRLSTRLALTHSAPALLMAVAAGLALYSLVRVAGMLGESSVRDLDALGREAALHRAGWSLDIAMRHGLAACHAGGSDIVVRDTIENTSRQLEAALAAHAADGMRRSAVARVAERYVAHAERLLRGDVCTQLAARRVQEARWRLDEDFTNAWVARAAALSEAAREHERSVLAQARSAMWTGSAITLLALLLAFVLARSMSRAIEQPLRALATGARRIGRGDLEVPVPVAGPHEVQALGSDLERMRLRLRELEAVRQGFLASVSHELRTPLTTIRESLALLGDAVAGPLVARQARLVRIARDACEREIRYVTTLLDLSRLRGGTPLLRERDVALDDVIGRAVADESQSARDAEVDLVMSSAGSSPRMQVDAALLERAVANLVRNAVAVSPRSGVVRVAREVCVGGPEGRSGAWARIDVSDSGPGVPESIRDAVFEPFVTRAVERSRKGVGVGLGLALAREVARAHGGDLRLASTGADGSTFELWLPIGGAAPSRDAKASAARPSASASSTAAPRTIDGHERDTDAAVTETTNHEE